MVKNWVRQNENKSLYTTKVCIALGVCYAIKKNNKSYFQIMSQSRKFQNNLIRYNALPSQFIHYTLYIVAK